MKIIALKLNIKTLLVFFFLTTSLFAQPTISLKEKPTNTESLNRTSLAPNATITGNFSICLPGPNTTQLTGSGTPAAINPWTSLNPAVATVDNTGLVTSVSFGATTITYTDSLGNVVSQNVYVSTFPTISSPSGTYTTCAAGTLQLTGSLFPNATIPWESTNNAIATIDNTGLVTGVSGGVVNILYRNLGGCTVLQPITINPLLSPNVVCGAATFNQITFNWGAVTGASTYTVVYTVNGGGFQLGASGNILTYTKTGLSPGDYVDIYVTPTGTVGSCFTVGTVRCFTTACTPATSPLSPTLTPTHPSCASATGTVTITGVAGETYNFDGGGYSATLVYSGLAAGSSHFVTAKNAVGCISPVANITLNAQPPTPIAPILTPTQPTCTVATGCVTITATPGETYSFDGSAYSGTLVYCGLPSGSSHTVTAKNAAGCISPIANITLNTQPATPATPTLTPTQPTCSVATGCVTITSVAGETYSFDGSAYTGTLIYCGLPASSSHNVTAKNVAGCISAIANITLNAQPLTPTAPTLTPTQPTCTVATGCVTITGVAGETYSFDGSAYSGTLVYCGLAAGSTHNVTAKNADGCISSITNITLNVQPLSPSAPILTPTQPTCTVATGCVTITATAGETYSFDGSAYTGTLIYCGLAAGSSHTVTAKNGLGCISAIANITLNAQPATPVPPTLTPTQPTCTVATGCVTITGVAGETYSFDGSSYTGTLIYCGLAAGSSHNVTAKNAAGCISTIANITLNVQPLTPAAPTLTPTQPTCSVATGCVTITGIAGETYSFDGSAYTGTLIYCGLAAGSSHNVTAQNADGCISSITNITLNAQPPTPIAPILTPTQPTCTVATGCVTITATAGETYSLNGGAYSGTLIYCGLPAGSSHTVTAKNAAGCISAIANITLNAQPLTPSTPTLTPTEPTCTVATGCVTITATAGETYSFDGSAYVGTLTYCGLTAGSSHTVTAKNVAGCISLVANITLISQPISPSAPTLTITHPTCSLATGTITITGVAGETYSFDGGLYNGTLVYSGLAAGSSHNVTAQNAGGCISLISNAILNAQPPTPSAPFSTGNITQCELPTIQTLDANNAITPTPLQTISWFSVASGGIGGLTPTLNTSGTITYYAESNDGTCPSLTRTAVTLTINPAPTAPVSTGNITQCEVSPIQTLDANTAITPNPLQTISWFSVASGGIGGLTPTLNTSGTITYYAESNDGTCPSLTRTAVTLTINPAPTAPISTGNITQCEISPIQTLDANTAITPNPLQTISWFSVASGGIGGLTPTLNTSGTITYYAESNDGTCPSLTRTAVTLTINPAPTAPISTGNITQCEVSPIQTLDANTAITPNPLQTISWFSVASGGIGGLTPTLNTSGTITYYAESNDGTCPSLTRTAVTLTINPAPTAPISTGNITQCEISPIQTLDANTAITPNPLQTISWFNAASGGTGGLTPILNTTGTITYYAESNDGTCPSLTRTAVTLTINPAPTAPISTGNITQCEVSPIQTLDANNAITPNPLQTISWFSVASGGIGGLTPTLNTSGTITYYAESNDGTCPSYSRTAVTLTINPAPTAPVSTGNITQCEISPIQTLDANTAITPNPLQTISWFNAASGGTGGLTPTLNTTGTITYYAASNDGTCPSLTRTAVTLTINPAPTAPISTGNITQCEVSPIQTLDANNAITPNPLQTISWFSVASGGIGGLTPTLNTSGTITYYAESNDGTCPSLTRTAVTLTINPAPTAPVSTGNITQCEISPIQTLDTNTAITPNPLQTISWFNVASGGIGGLTPTLNTTGTITYYAESNDGTCLSLTRTAVTLTINPAPTAPVSTGNITQCEISPIQTLDANTAITPNPLQTISWFNAASGGTGGLTPILNTTGTITYYAESNDGTCPSLTRTAVTLTINPAPTAPISTGNITQCEVSPIQTLDANNAITPNPLQTISWFSVASGGIGGLTPTLNTSGTITYYAESNDGTCPSYSRTAVTLTINPAPTAPISTGNITQCEISPIQTLDANTAITPNPLQTISWFNAASGGTGGLTPILNTTGTITYYAESNDGTCPSLTRTAVTLTINPAPTAPLSSGNITQCEILPIQTLDANTAITPNPLQTISWFSVASGGIGGITPTLNAIGTITYYAESNDGTCPSLTRTAVTLTINPAPTAPISTGNIAQCEISPIQTLDANDAITPISGQTIAWFNSASGGISVPSATLNTTGTITYYAQTNDGTCNSLTRTAVTLTINPAPAAPISTGNIIQCEVSPLQTLNANTAITPISGQTFSWFDASIGGNPVLNPSLNSIGTITYYAQANDATCKSFTKTAVTLTINRAPAAPISGGDIFQCVLSPVQTITAIATVPVGQTITWYNAPIGGSVVPVPSINTAISVIYYAQANDGTCNSLTRTPIILTINPLPIVPTIGAVTQPDCVITTGSATIFPVQAGVTYSLDNGPFTSTAFYNLLTAGTVHTLVAKNSGGCLSPPALVNIIAQPVTPNAPTFVITQPTCTLATGSITINGVAGQTYSFDNSPYSNTLTYSGLIASSTHTIKTKNSSNCISGITTFTLNVQPLTPSLPTLTPVQPTCTEATGSILISNVLGQTFSFDGGPFSSTLTYALLPAGSTHTVRTVNGSGCISAPSTITLDLQPPTPATPSFVITQTDCNSAVGALTILNVAGELYSFNESQYSNTLIYSNLVAGTYPLTAQNGVGCISAIANVVINPQPITLTPAITDGVICVDLLSGIPFQTYTLDTQLSAATHTFVWTLDGLNTSDSGSSIMATQAGVYTVVATNIASTCPSLTATATVTTSYPGLGIATQVIGQFSNDTSIIVTIGTGTGPFLYQLDYGPIQQSNIFTNVAPGTHKIIVRDENGCTYLTSEVIILGYMNFFTPNGDGFNDTWNVIGLKGQKATIHIFDRYGKYIKQISPNDEGWDGTFNSQELPSTDYWFTAEYTENGQQKEFKSHFSLVR